MDKVDLPIMAATKTLKEALGKLHKSGRSALVTTTEAGEHIVLDRMRLLARGHYGNMMLGDIASRRVAVSLPEHRREISAATADLLDENNSLFGIGEIKGKFATVYTRHEHIAARIQVAIGYCECVGPEHETCSPDAYPDGKCARGHRLVCTRA